MKNQIEIASEVNNSSSASTGAHDTRKKKSKFVLSLFVVVSLGMATYGNINTQHSNNNYASEQWEYKIEMIRFDNITSLSKQEAESFFNKLGRDGWEFVESGNGRACIFKRKLP